MYFLCNEVNFKGETALKSLLVTFKFLCRFLDSGFPIALLIDLTAALWIASAHITSLTTDCVLSMVWLLLSPDPVKVNLIIYKNGGRCALSSLHIKLVFSASLSFPWKGKWSAVDADTKWWQLRKCLEMLIINYGIRPWQRVPSPSPVMVMELSHTSFHLAGNGISLDMAHFHLSAGNCVVRIHSRIWEELVTQVFSDWKI